MDNYSAVSAKKIRHPAERVMVTIAIIWTVLLAVIALAVIIGYAGDLFEPGDISEDDLGTALSVFALVFLLPLAMPLLYAYQYWNAIVNSVEITPANYPGIYAIFKEQAAKLGFPEDKLPRLFLTNGNGTQNAYSSRRGFLQRFYVMLYSDIVDLYTEVNLPEHEDVIRFVISHELGHILLGHCTIWRQYLNSMVSFIGLGASFSRAQEYSADRAAASVCRQGYYAKGFMPLVVGKYQSKYVDIPAFCQNDVAEKSRFWLRLMNFLADHPVARRRIEALDRMDREGWEHVYGKML